MLEPTQIDGKALIDEGLGSAYEYFVKRRFIVNLIHLHDLKLILDVYYESGITNRLQSICAEHTIALEGDFRKNLDGMIASDSTPFSKILMVKGDLKNLPFSTNSFDLVFNSRDLTQENPVRQIRELARVSRRFVLIFAPNRLHIGDIFYRSYLRLINPKSGGKHLNSTTIKNLSLLVRMANLSIFDRGGIDMPFWPSHFSIRGLIREGKKVRNHTIQSLLKLLFYQSALEDSLPKRLKAAQAHIIYVLGLKIKNNR